MEAFVQKYHREDIENLLKAKNAVITINFDLKSLFEENEKLFTQLKYFFDDEHAKWKKAVVSQIADIVQKDNSIQLPHQKMEIEFDFRNHPQRIQWPKITTDLHQLVEFKGYVFRSSTPKKLEMFREVLCVKCKQTTVIQADRLYDYAFKCSRKCIIKEDCEGKMIFTKKQEEIPPLENTVDFQIFKVQELDKFTPKNRYYSIEVEGKLVDSCSIGDTVYILGTFETRNDLQTKEIKKVVIRAVAITKTFEFKQSINSTEKEATFNAWMANKKLNNNSELDARNELLKAVAPELSNCAILKLALLIVLCTGGKAKSCKTREERVERMTNRDISHLLFIGLPGLGKSQLLKSASKISSRAIKCIGSACSLAGLTASSYKEDKETHVEAGALVLANHGICCIDEFNLLSLRNRGALHDAMEHQKFSFMQANLKVEVNTRCSVIASMNHKAEQTADARNKNIKNAAFNIEPSLISRFDFVFFLEKPEDPNFDLNIIESIINESRTEYAEVLNQWTMEQLQLHVMSAKNLACQFTPDVLKLIFNYYRFCNACEEVDNSRKTMRLLKSLERLTIGHAKLMLRNHTKLIDGLTVIWLMENSWSFGDLISPENVVTSEIPVGPSQKCIRHIFTTLKLGELYEVFENEQKELANDTKSTIEFDVSVKEQVSEKQEVKKLFNKTGALKRRSDEKNKHEKTLVSEKLPEVLRKSFAIETIDDIFESDSDEQKGSANHETTQHQSKLQSSDIEELEDFFINQMDNEMENHLNSFSVPKENMSTQRETQMKPSTSKADADMSKNNKENGNKVTFKKSSLGSLLGRMTKESRDEGSKRRKLSSDDEDIFAAFTDEVLEKPEKLSKPLESPKNVPAKKTSMGFFSRLKAFEFSSQSSQQKQSSASTSISENLLALSNQLTGNTNQSTPNKSVSKMASLVSDEAMKALDEELDNWD